MEKAEQMGKNRTGIDMSPMESEEMLSGAEEFTTVEEDRQTIDPNLAYPSLVAIDTQYIIESEPVGSVPMPGTLKGALKSGMKKATGHNPEVFLNKLGERLAFERSGVRLYEAILTKCEAADDMRPAGPVTADELREIRDQEAEHFVMLKEAMTSLGADPTAQTPDADVMGVANMGVMHALNDPRTSMSQCLGVLLTVELTDNAGWELLIALAEELGMNKLVKKFQAALTQEEEHVRIVRSWYEQMVLSQSAGERVEVTH